VFLVAASVALIAYLLVYWSQNSEDDPPVRADPPDKEQSEAPSLAPVDPSRGESAGNGNAIGTAGGQSGTTGSSSAGGGNTDTGQRPPDPRRPTSPVNGEPWTVPELSMEFVWIDALRCWVGKYEVTNGEYRHVIGKRLHSLHDSGAYRQHSLNGDRQPVVNVSYNDAVMFAKVLTGGEKTKGRLPEGFVYSLPSSQQWEAFALCGERRAFPWGNRPPPRYGNYASEGDGLNTAIAGYSDGHAVTCAVEKSGENSWGLFGVGGNVWEWTTEQSGTGTRRLRGAGWDDYNLRALTIIHYTPFDQSQGSHRFGFRLVLCRSPDSE